MSKIVFSYRGTDAQGAEARGTVEALDKEDALRQLRGLEAHGLRDLAIEMGSITMAPLRPSSRPSLSTSPSPSTDFLRY